MSLHLTCRTLRVKPSRWLAAIGAITGAISAPLAALILSLRPAPVASWAVFGVTATVFASVVASRRLRRNTTLDLDARSIEDGYEAGGKLILHARNGAVIEAEPADRSPGDVLSELGLTLDRRALSASLRGVLGTFTRGLLAFMVTWFAALVAMAPLRSLPASMLVSPALALVATVLVVKKLRPRVTVGLDGLRTSGVLRPRFVPYSAIRSVRILAFDRDQAPGEQIVIDTEGRPLVLPLVAQPRARVDAIAARIRDGRARYERESARALESLERAGRPVGEWLAALQKLAAPGGFRQAALDRSDLERVVADPKVPLERRVGAALALRDDPEARTAVRVAADQAADPRVRVALEAASDEALDEERLQATLE